LKKHTGGFKVRGVDNKTGKIRHLRCEENRRQNVVFKNLQDAEYALDVAMYQKWDDYDELEWREWGNEDEKTTWSIVKVKDASNYP
jgi:hypothetical protein